MTLKHLVILVVLLLPSSASAATIGRVQSNSLGLVGHWTFDGSATNWATGQTSDSSGQNNTGQLIAMSTTTSPVVGKTGQGLKFDGASNWINIADSSSLSAGTSFTFSAWVNPSVTNTRAIMQRNSSTNQGMIRFQNGVLGYHQYGVSGFAVYGTAGIELNKWTLITATYDTTSNLMTFYLNGTQDQQATPAGTVLIEHNPVNIGADRGQQDYLPFIGSMDDVRLYNRALSAQEVRQLYSSGTANVARSNTGANAPLSSGLVAHWTFDGPATNWATGKTNDLSGGGNTGQLISMSTTTTPSLGRSGQAFRFDGSSCVTLTSAAITSALQESFTLSLWLKREIMGTSPLFSSSGQAGSASAVSASSSVGTISRTFRFQAGTTTISATWLNRSSFTTGSEWTHIALTRAAADGRRIIYVEGSTLASSVFGSAGTLVFDGDSIIRIGCNGVSFLSGAVDDVRIYNRVLSSAEIRQLHRMGQRGL